MARSRTYFIRLAQFLPKDLPLARLMARLCVIWQDLLYERSGIFEDSGFDALDKRGNRDLQRRLFFLRANSRSLYSTGKLIASLSGDLTFKDWLEQDPILQKHFGKKRAAFNCEVECVNHVRNTIGAHAEESVGDAIDYFADDDEARFEIHSEDFMRPHLGTEVLLATLMKAGTPAQRLEAYRKTVSAIARANNAAISLLSSVADTYVKKRGLLQG